VVVVVNDSVMVIPVLTHLYTNTSPRRSDDPSSNYFTVHDIDQPHTMPVPLSSSDPWAIYLDHSHAALFAVKLDSSKTLATHDVKPTIDKCVYSLIHKAKLWTVQLERKSSEPTCTNESINKQNSEGSVKPLCVLAAESRLSHCDELSQVKQRLVEVLGKHQLQLHAIFASLCYL